MAMRLAHCGGITEFVILVRCHITMYNIFTYILEVHFLLFPLQNLENMQPCPGNCLEHCTSVRSVTCMLQAMHDLMSLQISYVCRSNDTTDLMLLQISCYCKFHFSADLMSPFITSLLMLWKSYLLIMHSPPGKKWSIILNWIFLTCPESGFSSNILSHRAKDVLKVS